MSKLNDRPAELSDQVPSHAESAPMLTGHTVLVVEPEIIIALGIQSVLETLGSPDTVLAQSIEDADAKGPRWTKARLAIIELEADDPRTIEFARQVSQSGIPVLGTSADVSLACGVPELPGTPILIKPVTDIGLSDAIQARLAQNPLPDVT